VEEQETLGIQKKASFFRKQDDLEEYFGEERIRLDRTHDMADEVLQ
jgi:hypothetical protein